MDEALQCVFVAQGEMQAKQVRSFLAAEGIETTESGEALRHTHGLMMNGLGVVEILVRPDDAERAATLIAAAEAGELRLGDQPGPTDPEP